MTLVRSFFGKLAWSAAVAAVGLSPLIGVLSAQDVQLDAQGRAMLDPLRLQAIPPEPLLARLGIHPNDVVADIGAGPGFLTLPLARLVPHGRVIATDIRADYLQILKRRARAAHVDSITTITVATDHPGLPANSTDLAILSQVDHYLPNRARFLGELTNALRRGGRIAIVNFERHHPAVIVATRAASLELVDEWAPSPGFFAAVFRPSRRQP